MIKYVSAAIGFCVLGISLPALSQGVSQTELENCASIENGVKRLICYDKVVKGDGTATAAAAQARNQGGGQRSSRQARDERLTGQPEQRRGQNRYDEFGKEADRVEEVNSMPVEIARSEKDSLGYWEIELVNGQRWKQVESQAFQLPKDGSYYIERGVFNGFFLVREGQNRKLRVKRVD